MKRLIAALTTGLVALALVVVGAAAPASAHTATLSSATACNSDGSAKITWTLDNDWAQVVTVTSSSDTAVIPVNATVAATKVNGSGDTQSTFVQNVPAPAAGYTNTITLGLKWTDGTTQTTSATAKVGSYCTVPSKTDASAAVVLTPAACGTAETVAEGAIANATWTSSTVTSTSYTIVATASTGHLFGTPSSGGTLSKSNSVETFSGALNAATSPSRCTTASAAIVVTAATCQAAGSVTEGAVSHATWETPLYTGLNYTLVADAAPGYEFPNGPGVSNANTKLTYTGTEAAVLTGQPCEDYKIVAWTMPSWDNSTTPTWSQTYFTSEEESTPNLSALDSRLTEACGVQYQVDIYYNSQITTNLINGGYLDGPNNPQEDLIPGGWGVAYKLVQGPACATPVVPTETDSCSNGGSITITPALGVVYYLDGKLVNTTGTSPVVVSVTDGSHTVTATALSGYLLQGYPPYGWSFTVNTDCTATYSTSGTCSSANGISQETVTLVFNNPSSSDATFTVTSTDGTVTGSGIYDVPAHTAGDSQQVGTVGSAGGTFDVSINGGTPIGVTVASYTGCLLVTPADPTFTPASCTGTTVNGGSVTVDGNPYVTYDLEYVSGSNPYTTTEFPTTSPFTISNLLPDVYQVVVTPDTGYLLATPNDFPFVVTIPDVNCVGTPITPQLTSTIPSCTPQTQLQAGTFKAADVEVQGTFQVTLDSNIDWTINGTPITTSSPVSEPDGSYTVVATLTSAAIAEGYTFAPPTGGATYTLNADSTVATWGPLTFSAPSCSLPTLASWNAGVTPTNATCTATSAVDGTLDLVHSTGQAGEVIYTVTNDATHAVVYTGSGGNNSPTNGDYLLKVAPGTYTVVATPAHSGDGISGNPDSTPYETFAPITIAVDGVDCDGSLAFTGGTIAWIGFALAGGMLFLGFALMFIRRRGHRTAE